MEYEEREKVKQEAWALFSKTKTAAGKANIIMHGIITPHYWRARKNLEARKDLAACLRKIRGKRYYKHYELDIDHYTEHWLFSQKNQEFMKDGVFEALCEYYEPKECKYLPLGCTEYQF